MSSALIVGISGVTNGGKSTLLRNLQKVLPNTLVLNQDDYFHPLDSPLHVPCPGGIKHINWDIISSIDMEKLIKDVELMAGNKKLSNAGLQISHPSYEDVLSTSRDTELDESCMTAIMPLLKKLDKAKPILLIDGFLIYDDSRLAKLCDLKFFVTLPEDECFLRRSNRVYDPPDPPGYFEACVWPMYVEYLNRVSKQYTDLIFMDGRKKKENILIPALEKIVLSCNDS